MNFRNLFGLFLSLFFASLLPNSVLADNVITISVKDLADNHNDEGTPIIKFSLKANGDVTLTGVEGVYDPSKRVYTMTDKTVTITGDVTEFDCDYAKMETLDCSQSALLEELYCKSANIKHLKVAGLTKLLKVDCRYNDFENLDFTGCAALTSLKASGSKTKTLVLKGCSALKTLEVSTSSDLEVLDLSECPNIETVECQNCNLNTLNLQKCEKLNDLSCYENKLTSIDFSDCKSLTSVTCGSNPLTKLEITNSPKLQYLSCYNAELTQLNVSGSQKLTDLYCEKNKLTSVNIENCPALARMYLFFNQISKEEMQRIVEALPNREETQKAKITAIGKASDREEGNKCSKKTVAAAKAKNWSIFFKNEDTYQIEEYEGEATYYAVTLESNEGGTLEIVGMPSDALNQIEEGTLLKVKATPNEGYKLVELLAGEVSIMDVMEFTVNADVTVKAVFQEITCKVELSAEGPGIIRIEGYDAEQLKKVKPGQLLKVIAVPVPGTDNVELKTLTLTVINPDGENTVTDILASKQFTTTEKDVRVNAVFEVVKSVNKIEEATFAVYANEADNVLSVEKATPLTHVEVYAVEGRVVRTATTNNEGAARMDISLLSKGTYIVRVANKAVKVIL